MAQREHGRLVLHGLRDRLVAERPGDLDNRLDNLLVDQVVGDVADEVAVVSVISRISSCGSIPVSLSWASIRRVNSGSPIDFPEMLTSSFSARPCLACSAIRSIALRITQRSISCTRSNRSAVARNAVAG